MMSTARQALEDAFQEDSDDEDAIDDTKLLNFNEDEGKHDFFPGFDPIHLKHRGCLGRGLCLPRDVGKRGIPPFARKFRPDLIDVPQGARLREKSEKLAEGEEVEDSDDEEEEVEEELGYISPLDKVNPYSTFKRALTCMPLPLFWRLMLTNDPSFPNAK